MEPATVCSGTRSVTCINIDGAPVNPPVSVSGGGGGGGGAYLFPTIL
jgi:hypothetical protein